MDATADQNRIKKTRETITRFPKSPGVYLMKDSLGRMLYVGNARISVPAPAAPSRTPPVTCPDD